MTEPRPDRRNRRHSHDTGYAHSTGAGARATTNPLPPCHAVARRTANDSFYRFLYNTIGHDWLWYERPPDDRRGAGHVHHDESVSIYVLYVGGVPAGYTEIDSRRFPEIEIAYLGLMPEFIRQGTGAVPRRLVARHRLAIEPGAGPYPHLQPGSPPRPCRSIRKPVLNLANRKELPFQTRGNCLISRADTPTQRRGCILTKTI